jgi:GntR family transcriptional regulator / MocR family aminotransferase
MLATLGAVRARLRSNNVAETQTNLAWEALFDLSGVSAPGPLHVRLTAAIRTAIRAGRLPLGAALPPSRALAADLGISRSTVTRAYGQLVTEGYLSGRTGSGTRVRWSPEEDPAGRGRHPAGAAHHPVRYDLAEWTPDFRAFPRTRWLEALRIAAQTAPFDQLGYSSHGGEERLRAVLADHLNRRRGAAATPGTISVFPGAAAAMSQLGRALAEDGHTHMGVEDPGSNGLWQPARSAGLELVPLPVDDDGLVVGELEAHPRLRAVSVGPAHNAATGCVLAPHRRSALLAWARRVGGLVVEDDYDSEFSYDGPSLPAIHGADPERVALLGSMSRTLTPTVGVGWVVTPRRLVGPVRAATPVPLGPPALTQLALAQFMESGAYDRHLRASRQRFRARRNALIAALARELPECRIRGAGGGLHLVLELPAGSDTAAIVAAARRRDMRLCDIGESRFRPDPDEFRLLVGYGNLADSLVDEAVAVLAEVIRRVTRQGGLTPEQMGPSTGRRRWRRRFPRRASP